MRDWPDDVEWDAAGPPVPRGVFAQVALACGVWLAAIIAMIVLFG